MSVVRYFILAVALTTGALAASPEPASSQVSPGKSPNIILITLDTTRADRMGFLGSKRGVTPNLDTLAKDSAVFARAYSQVALTPPSHATIFTGTYPQFHHVNDMQDPLPPDVPYTPEILHVYGYKTAAFLGAIVLKAEPPYVPGFDRGFDTYDADFHDEGVGEDRFSTVQRRGFEVVTRALAWLDKHPKGPFFMWVHLYDAHDPYIPPEPYKTRYASEPYDGGIAYEDAAVGKLLEQLKSRGLYDGAVMAVMADHGESLGAHGEDTHGVFLYDETIHVPLLIKLPHAAAAGKKIENRVELVDVAPTLLQEVGIAIPPEMQGESLLSLMKDGVSPAWHDRPAYSQAEYPHNSFGWSALRSLRAEKYFYVQAPRRELYDESKDPKSEHNLAGSSAAVADTLAGHLQDLRKKTSRARTAPKAELDPAAQEKLGALGYLASTSENLKTDLDQGPDPKDNIEIANMLHRANDLQEDMHADESIALLEQIIARNPTYAFYLKLGTWEMRKEDFQKAVPALQKALEMNPDATGPLLMLGKSLLAIQQNGPAIAALEKLVAKVPNAVEAHSFLEMAYARTDRVADAAKECRIVLQYDPDDYGSHLILGKSLAILGDPAAGEAMLKKAATLAPEDPTPHVWLADVYDKNGQKAEAEKERAEAEKLKAALPQQ
ncbi:MAG: sulfatase-like hydrolase/transferase [Terriglobales bacterium]|jgi:arylsulfatase A-like enzyme/Flp pilus assembly protein TadD